MLTLQKWILAPALVFGMVGVADSSQAKAEFGIYAGRGLSISIGSGYGGYRSLYAPSYRSVYGHGWGSPYHHSYRPSGHYHYHPQEVIRHGSHYHLVPGHFDYYPGSHGGHYRHHRGRHH